MSSLLEKREHTINKPKISLYNQNGPNGCSYEVLLQRVVNTAKEAGWSKVEIEQLLLECKRPINMRLFTYEEWLINREPNLDYDFLLEAIYNYFVVTHDKIS
jgi:hypothetical protein